MVSMTSHPAFPETEILSVSGTAGSQTIRPPLQLYRYMLFGNMNPIQDDDILID